MTQLDKLEIALDKVFNKSAPVKLSEDSRKAVASMMWSIALVCGLLQLYMGWRLWDAWHYLDTTVSTGSAAYGAAFGISSKADGLGVAFYGVLVLLLVSGVLLLLSAPGLKAMQKAGWDLAFNSLLINVLYGVVVVFTDYGSFDILFAVALTSVVGAYLLFQVRGHFMKSALSPHKAK